MSSFIGRISGGSIPSAALLSVAIMLLAGFAATRLTKRVGLPNVTAYIGAGILIGPCALNLIPGEIMQGMDFITDIALAFIAFGVGKYLKLDLLRGSGRKVIFITLAEALTAGVVVTLVMRFVFHIDLQIALLLGAIGSATAPASTIMTIRQYHAKGDFVNLLLQVVALDDAVALIAFSVCAALCGSESVGASVVLLPLLYNVLGLAAGALLGWLLSKLITSGRTEDNRLVLAITAMLVISGLCDALDISPLLPCMALGTVYANTGGERSLFHQASAFAPPILTMFFVLSGMRLDLAALPVTGMVGVAYFIVRILGKYVGAYAGCAACEESPQTRRCLGLALIPQAGVSIGLAFLGSRLLPPESGALLTTIILSSAVLYELIGPACAKAALRFSGTIAPQRAEATPSQASIPAGAEAAEHR